MAKNSGVTNKTTTPGIPSPFDGLVQIGVIVKGNEINVQAYIDAEVKAGRKCHDYGTYVGIFGKPTK